MSLGLYIHIPFCLKKCYYCDFSITLDRSSKARSDFLLALAWEMEQARQKYGKLSFETLYFGGGTPSALNIQEMTSLAESLHKHFQFEKDFEWTCEVNPGDIDAEDLKAYKELGINRLSIGGETFDDERLVALNRSHGVKEIYSMFDALQKSGFDNVNLDLINHLPGQQVEDVVRDVKQAIDLSPAQITFYDLDVQKKTVFGKRYLEGDLNLASEGDHEQMILKSQEILKSTGYEQVELATFAKPGFASRHNFIYWDQKDYLGLGPSAFSCMKGRRTQLASSFSEYLKKWKSQDEKFCFEDEVTPEKREAEKLMMGLRLARGVNLDGFKLIKDSLEQKVPIFEEEGLLHQEGQHLFLTEQGKLVAEEVIANLLS